jgi:hypothetical protein
MNEGSGTSVANTGDAAGYTLTIGQGIDANGILTTEPNNNPQWVNDPCRGWCLEFDGEAGFSGGEESTNLGGDYLVVPPLNLNSDTVSFTMWVNPNPTFGKTGQEFLDGFTGLLTTRGARGNVSSDGAAGINFGGGSGFVYDGMLGYTWNQNSSSTWNWDSDLFPVNLQWNFVAITIEPSQATAYQVDDVNMVLELATNVIPHQVQYFDGNSIIGGDLNGSLRFYKGRMSDVRVYDRTLSVAEIMGMAGVSGTVYVPLDSPADLIVGDKDPCYPTVDDIIDFFDYAEFSESWLEDKLWP